MCLSVILSTQFSLGRLFGALWRSLIQNGVATWRALRDWQDERLRERQRREVIAKHTRKAGMPPEISVVSPDTASAALPRAPRKRENEEAPLPPSQPAAVRPAAPARPPKVSMPAPPLPLADSEQATKAPAERRKGEYTLPPLALLDA